MRKPKERKKREARSMAGAVPYSHEDNDLAHEYFNLKFEGYAFRFEDTELTQKAKQEEVNLIE